MFVSNPLWESHLFRSTWGWISLCQMMLQADCLSVRITADTNKLLMLLLKPVSVRPRSSKLSLSPMIYWQHCICLPLPLQAKFLTNPRPGYQAIIKNVWQDFRAGRDGSVEAGRAGADGLSQVWQHRAVWLTAWIFSQAPWNLKLLVKVRKWTWNREKLCNLVVIKVDGERPS